MELGALYNWLKDQSETLLAQSDMLAAISTPNDTIFAWRMVRAQAHAYAVAAKEIKRQLQATDPRGDWRRWEDKQYWSN